jgi:hypothetical protein
MREPAFGQNPAKFRAKQEVRAGLMNLAVSRLKDGVEGAEKRAVIGPEDLWSLWKFV